MQNNNQPQSGRHIKSFWAITIIAVLAVVLGGIIYFYTQGNELQDDIYSISFTSPVQVHKQVKNPIVKLAPKPDVKTPVATSTTAQ